MAADRDPPGVDPSGERRAGQLRLRYRPAHDAQDVLAVDLRAQVDDVDGLVECRLGGERRAPAAVGDDHHEAARGQPPAHPDSGNSFSVPGIACESCTSGRRALPDGMYTSELTVGRIPSIPPG